MKKIKVLRDGRPATQEELSAAVAGRPLPPEAGYAAKPPLGVMPKQLWMEKRAQDLARAIHEYAAEGRYEPVGEWLTELHELWPHIDKAHLTGGRRKTMTTPKAPAAHPLGAADCSALAAKLARAIFAAGDEQESPCTRIQFKGGRWPNNERNQGGVGETPLAEIILEVLEAQNVRHEPPEGARQ